MLTSEGVGCDTFGETELELALRAAVPPALISVNGASKSAALIGRAVAAGARITLDSGRELPIAEKAAADAATTARVRIRLRPRLDGVEAPSDFASDGTSIREVFQSYKAGVPIDDAVALGRAALESRHVELVGVHAHLARQTADISLWRAQIASFAGLLAELSASWGGWLPAEIDVGGGWPFPMDPVGRRPAPGALERIHGSQARQISRHPVVLHDPGGAWDGVACCYIADPDGNIVELIQRPSAEPQQLPSSR